MYEFNYWRNRGPVRFFDSTDMPWDVRAVSNSSTHRSTYRIAHDGFTVHTADSYPLERTNTGPDE